MLRCTFYKSAKNSSLVTPYFLLLNLFISIQFISFYIIFCVTFPIPSLSRQNYLVLRSPIPSLSRQNFLVLCSPSPPFPTLPSPPLLQQTKLKSNECVSNEESSNPRWMYIEINNYNVLQIFILDFCLIILLWFSYLQLCYDVTYSKSPGL